MRLFSSTFQRARQYLAGQPPRPSDPAVPVPESAAALAEPASPAVKPDVAPQPVVVEVAPPPPVQEHSGETETAAQPATADVEQALADDPHSVTQHAASLVTADVVPPLAAADQPDATEPATPPVTGDVEPPFSAADHHVAAEPEAAAATDDSAEQEPDPASTATEPAALVPDPDVHEYIAKARAAREAGDPEAGRSLLEDAAVRFPNASAVWQERGRLAEAKRDWPEAERSWRAFLAMDPAPWTAHVGLALALREQGRLDEAEAVLAEQCERHPGEVVVHINYAWLAERRHDWAEAEGRWSSVLSRFPQAPHGYSGRGRALRALGRWDEARSVLDAAAARFPAASGPLHDLGRHAEAQRDWPAAEGFWRAFLAIDANPWWAYTSLANALREQGKIAEAEAVLAEQFDRFDKEAVFFIEYARLAERSKDWVKASERWDVVIRRFPQVTDAYTGQARALRELGRADEAHVFLLAAADRFPAASAPRHDLARLAEARRDWSRAERWWRASLAIDPAPWWAHVALANALREQDRVAEAEEVLVGQFDRFAREPAVFVEYARFAERAADWTEATARWASFTSRFPNQVQGYCGQARALRELGQFDRAQALAFQAVERFPTASGPIYELTRLAEARRDWPDAERWWTAYLEIDPAPWWAHVGLANVIREQGKTIEADGVLARRIEQSADEPSLHIAYGRFAQQRKDWPEAERRWSMVVERFPKVWEGYVGKALAARELGCPEDADATLREGKDSNPDRVELFIEHARLAQATQDWSQAQSRWSEVCSRFPKIQAGYEGLASVLAAIGKTEEASLMLKNAAEDLRTPVAGL